MLFISFLFLFRLLAQYEVHWCLLSTETLLALTTFRCLWIEFPQGFQIWWWNSLMMKISRKSYCQEIWIRFYRVKINFWLETKKQTFPLLDFFRSLVSITLEFNLREYFFFLFWVTQSLNIIKFNPLPEVREKYLEKTFLAFWGWLWHILQS